MKHLFLPFKIISITLLLSFYSLFLTAQNKKMTLSEDFSLQGHRGARGLMPENTIPAFLRCLDEGVFTLEMDVVASMDKQIVVSHEGWFNEVTCSHPNGQAVQRCDRNRFLIYNMTYQQVKKYDCGRRGDPKFPQQKPMPAHKPLLKEVIEYCDAYAVEKGLPQPKYNIEIKSNPKRDGELQPPPAEFVQLVQEVLEKSGAKERCIIQSFDERILQEMKKLDATVTLAYLTESPLPVEANLNKLGFVPDIYAPRHILVTKKMAKKVHEMDMQLIVWTVNDLKRMKKLVKKGVDSIISDYPNLWKELKSDN